MSNPIFLKYFTQSDQKRIAAGFSTIDGEIKNEAQRLKAILTTKRVLGGNQKGYFRYNEQMPLTVSFTGARIEELDQFFAARSQFGFAVLASRIPKAKPVLYLDSYSAAIHVRCHPEDKWRVDLVRAVEEYLSTEEEYLAYTGEISLPKPYDFRWENEWRLKVPKEGISFERVDFVLVPGEENCKRVRERFGQEAYDVIDHTKRVQSYRSAHQGRSPPLEEILGKHFQAQKNKIKEVKPREGIIALPQIIEEAWDEIRRSSLS